MLLSLGTLCTIGLRLDVGFDGVCWMEGLGALAPSNHSAETLTRLTNVTLLLLGLGIRGLHLCSLRRCSKGDVRGSSDEHCAVNGPVVDGPALLLVIGDSGAVARRGSHCQTMKGGAERMWTF
jgi:hypothetical protein